MTPHSPPPPALARSRMLATVALVTAALLWLVFLLLEKFFPQHDTLLGILALGAEAGVVGGLADWYAVTVLFRNPFGKLPLPALLREHTEIIPRNKARIAESMGKFVQENFMAPHILRKSMREMDASLALGDWLANEDNVKRISDVVQRVGPRLLQVFESKDIQAFLQENAIEWVKSTPMNQMASQVLRAVLENDFHHEALQLGLDSADKWVKAHPDKARDVARRIFEELGVGGLSRAAGWVGIDVQGRIIDTFLQQVETLLEDRAHPWRTGLEENAHDLMVTLGDDASDSAQRLNDFKNALVSSPAVVNFITSAVVILRDAVKNDLQKENSGLAANLRGALLRLGYHLQENQQVRNALNAEIEELAVVFADEYSDSIIRYVASRIHDWDTREMIAKIETEVGGDLHMIRVNGVVVGSFIGLLLGITKVLIEMS
ncbi:MAG: hypothetical protein K0R03_2306 [Moraxellaceae bacterium]|jgi:uncharacterized membrane-anchored protein YjiN (DUF445 family)|nr:hypothetical protein [Moraxellaceae bacterium]